MQVDASGNIYVAGSVARESAPHAFVAKLTPGGSRVAYFTVLAGSFQESATALALGPDGSVYVAGDTSSPDFPVTDGALQRTYTAGAFRQGFLIKLNTAGTVVYSTYINGISTQLTGIALGASGEVYLTGLGGPKYAFNGAESVQGFVLQLDAALNRVLLSTYGLGGGLIRVDGQGNIYLAGEAQPNFAGGNTQALTLPVFPAGGFQSTHDARFCLTLGSGPGGPGGQLTCRYQYVAKLNAAGTLVWATYVTGTFGAIVHGMAIDSAGNVIVAGTTNSDDYPVTAGAFQTAYSASAPPFTGTIATSYRDPPPAIGYVTKVNNNGTGLIWSTYFGGFDADRVTGMAVGSRGEIYISGRASSADLPGLAGVPDACRPSTVQRLGFVARLSSDGATAGPVQPVMGVPDCLYFSCAVLSEYPNDQNTWPMALLPDGTALVAGPDGTVADIDFLKSARVSCVVDPATNVQLRAVAPGQLVTLYGTDLAPDSSPEVGVSFNGVAAPILYSSAQQVNVQAPYEIAGRSTAELRVTNRQTALPLSETHALEIVDRQPSFFLAAQASLSPFPGYSVCGKTVTIGVAAVAINADGSVNSCENPAAAGSTVTLFVNGLGGTTPELGTGRIAQGPPARLDPSIDVRDPNSRPVNATTSTIPGTISGVSQVRLQLPADAGASSPFAVVPVVAGKTLRERLILIWTRPN